MTIVNDDSSVVSEQSFLLIDDTRGIIYDRRMFIIKATGRVHWSFARNIFLASFASQEISIRILLFGLMKLSHPLSTFQKIIWVWRTQKFDQLGTNERIETIFLQDCTGQSFTTYPVICHGPYSLDRSREFLLNKRISRVDLLVLSSSFQLLLTLKKYFYLEVILTRCQCYKTFFPHHWWWGLIS